MKWGTSLAWTLDPCLACKKDKVQRKGEEEGPRWGPGGRIKAQSCLAKAKGALYGCVSVGNM